MRREVVFTSVCARTHICTHSSVHSCVCVCLRKPVANVRCLDLLYSTAFSFKGFIYFYFMCLFRLHVHKCIRYVPGTCKRVMDPLELGL